MGNDDYREVPLTLAAALTPWAAAVAAGTSAGVFSRLPGEALAALAAFATLYAAMTVLVDARLRGWLAAHGAAAAWTAAFGTALVLVVAGVALADGAAVNLARAPWAPIFLFGVPVTVASAVGAIRAALRHGVARAARGLQMAGD